MRPVKRVEFTITRAEMWPWVQAMWTVLWRGGRRIKLTLTGEQTFTFEPDHDEPKPVREGLDHES